MTKKKISKALSDAGKDLKNPNSSKKLKEESALALSERAKINALKKNKK